jgi:hypothetical protein
MIPSILVDQISEVIGNMNGSNCDNDEIKVMVWGGLVMMQQHTATYKKKTTAHNRITGNSD